MMTLNTVSRKDQGFTLVELAIVLIIIGLLIGGTLKGQELINGARVTATTAQIKALEAGTLTFQDTYNGMPGDISSPTTRLPNCPATSEHCALTGNTAAGNGIVGPTTGPGPTLALTPNTNAAAGDRTLNESFAFFNHLFNADLLDGLDGTDTMSVGAGILGAKLGSAKMFRIGYMSADTDAPGSGTNDGELVDATIRPGHYLFLSSDNDPYTLTAADTDINNAAITPSEAGRIDAKYDDGAPNTGNAFAMGKDAAGGTAAAGDCTSDEIINAVYATSNRQNDCGLLIRFSN